jgi:hypothetical protein
MEDKKNNTEEKSLFPTNIVFSRTNITDFIEDIANKYNLDNLGDLIEEEIDNKEFEERFSRLPDIYITKLISRINKGEIKKEEELIFSLQSKIDIPNKTAVNITSDIKRKLIEISSGNFLDDGFYEKKNDPYREEVE